ncbi:hypothetical protein M9H77_35714 [Catharanthus roseus]|uniref:Uncharacterized protein n=1 Tax=Catharanthus roseus TaxID=4058 RepID=A0ACB9ZRI3_CATRO|nr:hypothetical protein M9H77_35714 [Catharanthus roseus]
MRCNRSNGRQLHATGEPVRILNPWMSAGEKPRHVIICAPRWRYSRDTGPCRRKQMRWCLQPQCLYEHILHHVHPVICWLAGLLRMNRMSWNALNLPKLSDNPIGHIRLYTIKVCNHPMVRRNPYISNLIGSIRSPLDLVSSHHV